MRFSRLAAVVLLALPLYGADKPSRAAEKGCIWEKFLDRKVGLQAWVQRCDFGFRKIDFLARGSSLAMRYSDGGEVAPLVDVYDLTAGETAEAGLRRLFNAHTDRKIASRCVLAPYTGSPSPKGVLRYTFLPDHAFGKELEAKANPNDVPDPPCGDFGDAPDGIQYFEVHPGARRVLFVRVGQDTPLFDEETLRILP